MKSFIFGGLLFSMSLGLFSEVQESSAEDSVQKKAHQIITQFFKDQSELTLLESINDSSRDEIAESSKSILSQVEGYFSLSNQESFKAIGNGRSVVREDLDIGRRVLSLKKKNISHSSKMNSETVFVHAMNNYKKGKSISEPFLSQLSRRYLNQAYYDLRKILVLDQNTLNRKYVLYMLGDVGMQLWDENKDMGGVLCMIELIRSHPEDTLSKMAWIKLNAQIHFGYTGSSGDNTPPEWIAFLEDLRVVAFKGVPEPSLSQNQTIL